MTASEINPASSSCQRWRDRRHSWRHTSEGGFNSLAYDVEELPDDTTARTYIEFHHYSGTYPAAALRFALRHGQELVGVAVLSIPVQAKVLTAVYPGLEPYRESLELGRLVLGDSVPANAETWFLARVWELAARNGVRGIVSFSDPVARTNLAGEVAFVGHVGTIYQASNALYLGRGTAGRLRLLPDGRLLSGRLLQKLRAGERGWEYGQRELVKWGATPWAPGQDRRQWLAQAMQEAGVRILAHPGNFRYGFRIGPGRNRVQVAMPSQPYPCICGAPKIDHPRLANAA